jgi:hypothetical protein
VLHRTDHSSITLSMYKFLNLNARGDIRVSANLKNLDVERTPSLVLVTRSYISEFPRRSNDRTFYNHNSSRTIQRIEVRHGLK